MLRASDLLRHVRINLAEDLKMFINFVLNTCMLAMFITREE